MRASDPGNRRLCALGTRGPLRLATAAVLAALAAPFVFPGCGNDPPLPRMRQGEPGDPCLIVVALPRNDTTALRSLAGGRSDWQGLAEEMLALEMPDLFPQPALDAAAEEALRIAVADVLDPIEGLLATFDLGDPRLDDARASALVGVEMLPDSTIDRLHGSDAFTEAFHDLAERYIRRAVIRLPLSLMDGPPDDLANFLAHEMGHALGYEGHLSEMWSEPPGRTWYWDHLMTVPIRLGQTWQPATSEDVFAIAERRYRLREGWIDAREPRFVDALPFSRTGD